MKLEKMTTSELTYGKLLEILSEAFFKQIKLDRPKLEEMIKSLKDDWKPGDHFRIRYEVASNLYLLEKDD